jgi:hypothetical protein
MGYSVEDDRIIRAAVKSAKISGESVRMWQQAMIADRAGTRRTLAGLPQGWLGEDPEREARIVAAANPNLANHAPRVEYPTSALEQGSRDPFGANGMEPPVVIRKGTPVEERTERQHQDAMQRRLGPRFYPGTEAPPKGDEIYIPSPNDHSRFDEATGRWVEKNPYREI